MIIKCFLRLTIYEIQTYSYRYSTPDLRLGSLFNYFHKCLNVNPITKVEKFHSKIYKHKMREYDSTLQLFFYLFYKKKKHFLIKK